MLTDGYLLLRGILTKTQQQAISSEIPFPPSAHKPLQTYPGDMAVQLASCILARELCDTLFKREEEIHRIGPTLIPKVPGEGVRGWHQDHRFWGDDSAYGELPPAVGVMFYPDGADENVGQLEVLPCSHKRWTTLHAFLAEADDGTHDGTSPASIANAHDMYRPIDMTRADVLLIDARTLHRSTPNRSAMVRRCLNVWCWFEPPTELVRFPIRERMLKA